MHCEDIYFTTLDHLLTKTTFPRREKGKSQFEIHYHQGMEKVELFVRFILLPAQEAFGNEMNDSHNTIQYQI